MRMANIKKHLRPQLIRSRKSTFSHAFASALAPFDSYDAVQVAAAIRDLGQDPDGDLLCAYCDKAAATWDHVFGRVIDGEFSGYGHHIRNLVPSCRTCNEKKGKMHWRDWMRKVSLASFLQRSERFEAFLSGGTKPVVQTLPPAADADFVRYREIRHQVFQLLKEADLLAAKLRLR